VKNVGESRAGEPHARIDGGERKPCDSRHRRATPGASRLPRPLPDPQNGVGLTPEPRSTGESLPVTGAERLPQGAGAAGEWGATPSGGARITRSGPSGVRRIGRIRKRVRLGRPTRCRRSGWSADVVARAGLAQPIGSLAQTWTAARRWPSSA
jgi:hypothetical protein